MKDCLSSLIYGKGQLFIVYLHRYILHQWHDYPQRNLNQEPSLSADFSCNSYLQEQRSWSSLRCWPMPKPWISLGCKHLLLLPHCAFKDTSIVIISSCRTFLPSTKSTTWELHKIVSAMSLCHSESLFKERAGSFSIKAKPQLSNNTHWINCVSQKPRAGRNMSTNLLLQKRTTDCGFFFSFSSLIYVYVYTQACTTMHVWRAESLKWAISLLPSCGLRGTEHRS